MVCASVLSREQQWCRVYFARAARGVVVGARREWELAVARGRVWEAAVEYGGALRAMAVGAQREWECVVGQ
ncbi:hypothetical protein CHLRE_02g095118v5 [Chlamydomonas reinhardtii]|uniref:Uncharacterized protein n=1 Tax=Chlamydomonas reinhardtii TaxID=3055 RepID=A0A2K3E1T0_CHLRE|nr:uncharacterized protein CHLRE_02g095118v5 [Chlamydomonas reinhardtii]PNW86734.1 hypothetical protein CHLRE_02g095118v5 [Chlamydomonas reinhardtii]